VRHVLKLTRWELWKLARRPSSYVGFVLCLVFAAVALIGFEWSQHKGKKIGGLAIDPSQYLNGPFFANFVLNIGFFALLPLVAATVAGSQLAGEHKDGTLRALLVRPPSRTAVYVAKALASLIWLELMVVFLCALALLIGHVAYGGGSLLIYIWEYRNAGFWIVPADDWPALLALACLGAARRWRSSSPRRCASRRSPTTRWSPTSARWARSSSRRCCSGCPTRSWARRSRRCCRPAT
jgi:hypothetical protein